MMPFQEASAAGRNRVGAAVSGKAPQSEVNYREAEDPAMACGACLHFDGAGVCDVVEGDIDPAAVSDLFEPAAPATPTEIPGMP
jgi:hypothetical protein